MRKSLSGDQTRLSMLSATVRSRATMFVAGDVGVMFFLLRMAFWLSVVLILLPTGTSQQVPANSIGYGALTLTAEHVILATGSEATQLAALPFGGDVISSTEALALPALPRHLAVVGAGYIGLELGIAFRKLGAEVTIIEAADRILPRYDVALSRRA